MAAKRSKKIDTEVTDRISSLPRNVIDDIVAFLPIGDAARTSVLSRKWRYIWAGNPQLVINKQVSEDIKKERSTDEFPQHYVNLVNGLLLQRQAPILKFILLVPLLPSSEYYSNVDRWMVFVSRQGLKELTLVNSNPIPYKIPSHMFSCPTLETLVISSCIFKAPTPTGNEIFKMLTLLNLQKITFEPLVLNIPKLLALRLAECQGIRHFNISARKLQFLILTDNDDLELSYYVNCTNLRYAYIGLSSGDVRHSTPQNERITLKKLFSYWPQLNELVLDASFLKYIAAGGTDTLKLPTEKNKLNRLVIFGISYDFKEMSCILRLIRVFFSNLHELEIWAAESVHNDMKAVYYLEFQKLVVNPSIQELAIVKMIHFSGSRAELLFVKFLLANGPLIERMYITEDENLNPMTRLQTSKQLLRFPRASPTAEIIFEEGYKIGKFPDI